MEDSLSEEVSEGDCTVQTVSIPDMYIMRDEKKSIKETSTHVSVSLQVTAMIPLGHMGDPEGEHGLGEGAEGA